MVQDVEGVGLKFELHPLVEVEQLGESYVALLQAREADAADSSRPKFLRELIEDLPRRRPR